MSLGNHELIEFEENNYEDLREEFIKENQDKFNEYIEREYTNYCVSLV